MPSIHPSIPPQVSEAQRYGLVRAVSYLYSRDFERLASTFVDLGFVTNNEDPAALEGLGPALRDAFSNATGGSEGRGESLLDLNFAKLSSNIADVAYRFPIRIPPYWSLVIRCLTILEGIALNYNPQFRVVKAVYPLVVRFLLRSSGTPVLRIALEEILLMPVQDPPDTFGDYTSSRRTRYRIRWSRLERFLRAASKPTSELLNPGDEQAAAAASASASASGSGDGEPLDATLDGEMLDLMLQYILSDNGAYLREALIEDILGALEDANLVVLRGLSLLSGGLIPPPDAYPDADRVAVITQLLRNLQKIAVDRGEKALESPSALVGTGGRPLSAVQVQALAQLSRMVLATAVERQSQRTLRRVFHGVERVLHSQQRPGRQV